MSEAETIDSPVMESEKRANVFTDWMSTMQGYTERVNRMSSSVAVVLVDFTGEKDSAEGKHAFSDKNGDIGSFSDRMSFFQISLDDFESQIVRIVEVLEDTSGRLPGYCSSPITGRISSENSKKADIMLAEELAEETKEKSVSALNACNIFGKTSSLIDGFIESLDDYYKIVNDMNRNMGYSKDEAVDDEEMADINTVRGVQHRMSKLNDVINSVDNQVKILIEAVYDSHTEKMV